MSCLSARRMVIAVSFIFIARACLALGESAIPSAIGRSGQLIVVTAPDWSSNHGALALYERTTDFAHPGEQTLRSWKPILSGAPVMLGRNGLGWGIGLHAQRPRKREGDNRSPAGVFELERTYGREARSPNDHFPYAQLSPRMEGIDDPGSHYYNRLVDPARIRDQDWTHFEKVDPANPMFRWCVMVKHNWQQRPGYGSCIYLHVWKSTNLPTSGCTAMSEPDLARIVRWLDRRQRPLLIQLPDSEWQAWKKDL